MNAPLPSLPLKKPTLRTIHEIKDVFRCSFTTARDHMATGKWPSYKLNGRWFMSDDQINEILKQALRNAQAIARRTTKQI